MGKVRNIAWNNVDDRDKVMTSYKLMVSLLSYLGSIFQGGKMTFLMEVSCNLDSKEKDTGLSMGQLLFYLSDHKFTILFLC